jgi:hypothetical protein
MNLRFCLLILTLPAVGAAPISAQAPPRPPNSPLRIVAHVVGGALLGSWAGYVTSQVAWSDWQGRTGRSAHRIRFSVTGGAVGLLAGSLLGTHRNKSKSVPAPLWERPVQRQMATGPITADEIRASPARTLTELLRTLRPLWLRSRGTDVLRPDLPSVGDAPTTGAVLADDPRAASGVRVYLNGTLLGGLDALDQVSVQSITGAQFFAAAAATLRWGAGNEDGAILLTTARAP